MNLKPLINALLPLCFATLILVYGVLGWNARDRLAQGQSDFVSYYTAARLVKQGHGEQLYDLDIQRQFQNDIVCVGQFPNNLLPFIHPPFELLWFLPLADLPYSLAFLLWTGISLACLIVGLFRMNGINARKPGWSHPWMTGLAVGAFFPLFITLLQGQDSAVIFLFLVLSLCRPRSPRQEVLAGFWMSFLLQKFQLLTPILLLVIIKKRWRTLSGFLAGSFLMTLVSLALVGVSGLKSYASLLLAMAGWVDRYGINPSRMHSLRGQWYALFYKDLPWLAISMTVISSLVLLAMLWRAWQKPWDEGSPIMGLKIALLVIISLLVSPHLNLHDLLLLLLPGFLIHQHLMREQSSSFRAREVWWIFLAVAYPGLLATLVVSEYIPLHLSVLGLALLSVKLFRLIRCSQGLDALDRRAVSPG